MAVTIKDIAQMAGVSISTVSLVLNQKGYVAPETRRKILGIIEELNYKPLHSARQLATRKTGNIGYIVWDSHFSEVEQFYSHIFLGMEYAVRGSDYYILLTTVKSQFDPKTDLPRYLKNNDVDGVALAGRVPHSLIQHLDEQMIPFVLIDYGLSGKSYNSIILDNFNGAYAAIRTLIQSGRKRIGFIGGTSFHPSIKERFRGYKEALEDFDLNSNGDADKYIYLEKTETSRLIGENGAEIILSQQPRPDAIFCCNDTTAFGVMSKIQSLGLRIPDDVAVVGFDDIPQSEFQSPRLSTVRVSKFTIGREAYILLREIIDNPNLPAQTRTISVEFVQRESS